MPIPTTTPPHPPSPPQGLHWKTGGAGEVRVSKTMEDDPWDAFLTVSPRGQFQQSPAWAQSKAGLGWHPWRVILVKDGAPRGGFQLLYRRSGYARVGYISKGPVVEQEDEPTWDTLLGCLKASMRRLWLGAVIVQPPDASVVEEAWLAKHRVVPERGMGIIDATLWFDLAGKPEDIMARMPGYNRTFVRQAVRRGVTVREGGMADLPKFYDLMLTTCQRQGTQPSPATLAELTCIWRAFDRHRRIRLTLAECQGDTLAALIAFGYGKRVTLWKKGWTSDDGNRRPNHLLYHETLEWAQAAGYSFCDFYSVRRDIAERLLRGEELLEEQARSRDRFHLGFGAKPVLLPQAWVCCAAWPFRVAYQWLQTVRNRRRQQTRQAGTPPADSGKPER